MSEGHEEEGKRGGGKEGKAPTTRTELGLEVPEKEGQEYRVHKTDRWRDPADPRGDPLSYDYCIHLIRDLGIVNRCELARLVDDHRAARGKDGISRNSIIALINDTSVFKPGEINDIIARSSALLTMESIGAARDLVEKARSTKDLGAVAMVMTSANNIKQLSSGGPTQVKEVRHKFDVGDFEAARERRLGEQEKRNQGAIVDVETDAVAPIMNLMKQEGE